jgi:hypothetical protein
MKVARSKLQAVMDKYDEDIQFMEKREVPEFVLKKLGIQITED